ncbi:MAG: protoporphyrinogen oxidase, partial [Firmicutes bacterium]|nr:protoporphyrinogen oxidase [Bacillota bacterium]
RVLRHHFGNEWVDIVAAPILSGIYAGDIDRLSLQATYPQLAHMEKTAGSLVAAAAHLPAPQEKGGLFATLGQGLQTVVDSLSHHLNKTTVYTQTIVQRIHPAERAGYCVETSRGKMDVSGVIVAAPAPFAVEMLPFLSARSQDFMHHIVHPRLAVVVAQYPLDVLQPFPVKTGFLVPKASGMHMTAATWVSAKWAYPRVVPAFVVRTFFGRAGEDVLQADDEEILRWHQNELRQIAGIQTDPDDAQVVRIDPGMPQYAVGHRKQVAGLQEDVAKWPGLALAGMYLDGVGMPDCVRVATQAAAQVAGHLLKE